MYKVKNLLDESEYAVKKIALNMKKKSANRIRNEIDTVLKEIRCLARIKNEFVVGYNHAWIEVLLSENAKKCEEEEEICQFEGENQHFLEDEDCLGKGDNEEWSFVLNYDEASSSGLNFSERSVNQLGKNKKYSMSLEKKDEKIKINNEVYRIKDIKKLKIYIQMELCKETVGDFLQKRQNMLTNDEMISAIKKFIDISKAVQHLHEDEKIIHRDLKPTNIFLTDNGEIKIGDFGLATELFNMKIHKFSSGDELSLSRKYSESSTAANLSSEDWTHLSFHTKNVGTPQYASPEQLNENYYDEKTDIYSLGIILFEMVYPLATGMERHQTLKELKENGKIPENLFNKYPTLTTLISEMVNKNSIKRPTAREVKDRLSEEIINMNNKTNSPLKRNRFFSEEILNSASPFEIFIKFDESEEENYDRYFIKILNGKLLILRDNNSSKATFVYNLSECEIIFNKDGVTDEIQIDHPFMSKITLKMIAPNYNFVEKLKQF